MLGGAGNLHLNVIHDTFGRDESNSSAARLFSPRTNDFAWNDDFTAFKALPLKWWDDASYIAYQTRDCCDDED